MEELLVDAFENMQTSNTSKRVTNANIGLYLKEAFTHSYQYFWIY